MVPNRDNYSNSQNCVNDLRPGFERFYQTVFWRIGSLSESCWFRGRMVINVNVLFKMGSWYTTVSFHKFICAMNFNNIVLIQNVVSQLCNTNKKRN